MSDRIKGPNPEQAKKNSYLEHSHFQLNGANIDFIGVFHTPETLSKYRADIEGSIERSDAVFTEGMPIRSGVYVEKTMREAYEVLIRFLSDNPSFVQKRGVKLEQFSTFEKFWQKTKEFPGIVFFTQVEKWAWEKKKPMYVADTRGDGKADQQAQLDQHALMAHKQTGADAITRLAEGGMLVTCAQVLLDIMKKNPRISRRAFVFGGITASAYIVADALLTSLQIDNRSLKWQPAERTTKEGGVLALHAEDALDTFLAPALNVASAHVAPGDLAVIYGLGHHDPARHYIENRIEQRIRAGIYRRVIPTRVPQLLTLEPLLGTEVAWKLKESLQL